MSSFEKSLSWALVWMALFVAQAAAQHDTTAIWVTNVDGTGTRLLARVIGHYRHEFPRWSHDGKQVAFNARPAGNDARKIFIVNADASQTREVGWGSMPTWSPSDKLLAYYVPDDKGAALAVESLDDHEWDLLTVGKSPRWSPDGDHLAATDGKNVFLIDMQSGKSRELFAEPYDEVYRGFDFSPDGSRLAVTVQNVGDTRRKLLIVDRLRADAASRVRLQSDLGGVVSFSPDGKRLVYSSGFQLYIIEVEGVQPSRLVPGQRGRNHHPHWSPDGRSIVFVSDRKPS